MTTSELIQSPTPVFWKYWLKLRDRDFGPRYTAIVKMFNYFERGQAEFNQMVQAIKELYPERNWGRAYCKGCPVLKINPDCDLHICVYGGDGNGTH